MLKSNKKTILLNQIMIGFNLFVSNRTTLAKEIKRNDFKKNFQFLILKNYIREMKEIFKSNV